VRILLDARTVGREYSGVGNYVFELVRAFSELDADVAFDLLVTKESRLRDLGLDARFAFHAAPFSHESHPLGDLWEHAVFPRMANRLGSDVLHGPAFLIPTRATRVAKVVTIHDLVAFTHPDTIPRKYAIYMRWLIRRAVLHAERVIAISESVRRNIERTIGLQEHVDVILSAVSSRFSVQPAHEIERVRVRYGIQGRYLLFVGNLEPRKNLPGLLRAFRLARSKAEPPVQLVIAGKLAWLSTPLLRELDSGNLPGDVITTGYVAEDDLAALYSGAAAFVFPTFWEGFGLPVLEAMACGVPVVASRVASIPEVAGDAAVLVDPYAEESIAAGILDALDPVRSRELVRRGHERVREFRWETTAQRTLDAYARARTGRP
jgi:glycosyltransferase involved in cell wall biosynthesis